jgi:hypothetical protein
LPNTPSSRQPIRKLEGEPTRHSYRLTEQGHGSDRARHEDG